MNFDHQAKTKTLILLVNLGTPSAATPKALRTYLREFLSDRRVVEIPRFIWWIILNLIILVVRPKKSAKLYQSIWTSEGSPLLVYTHSLSQSLRNRLGEDTIVDFAMRYGDKSIKETLESISQQYHVDNLVCLPLYPQYSATTTASVFDDLAKYYMNKRFIPSIKFINHYHDDLNYIQAISQSIKQYREKYGSSDKLVLSFHGIPKRNLLLGDPYFCECQKTARLIKESLGLQDEQLIVSFQSRFGKAEWLKPYTSEVLAKLGKNKESVQVVCPGFAVDCLETLEEIKVENMEVFKEAGGTDYSYIECLNDSSAHIDVFEKLIEPELNVIKHKKAITDDEVSKRAQRYQEIKSALKF